MRESVVCPAYPSPNRIIEPAPRAVSASLAGLGAIFGAGSAVMYFGGRSERAPQYAGLGIAVLAYALARLAFVS